MVLPLWTQPVDAIKSGRAAFYKCSGKVKVMNCGYKEKTILYFYGELPGADAELRAHIGSCSSCAADLEVLRNLSAGFSAFRPEPPVLRSELARSARGVPVAEWLMAGFRSLSLAGAATAAFLLAFQVLAPGSGTAGGSELDSRLDGVEYGIYSLRDDMGYSSSADFDYGCADIENQKEQAAEKVANT